MTRRRILQAEMRIDEMQALASLYALRSTEELSNIVRNQRSAFAPEALAIMCAELSHRGVIVDETETLAIEPDGNMMKRFLLGAATTACLAFVPYPTFVAISIWWLGKTGSKFTPFTAWLLSLGVGGIIAISCLIGYLASFFILYRLTKMQQTWRFIICSAIPVVLLYILMMVGIVTWLGDLINPESFAGAILIGVLAYLPGGLAAVGITMIGKSPNQALDRTSG